MFGVMNAVKLAFFRMAWRRTNQHNETYPVNVFDPALVSVGDRSYGGIKVYAVGSQGHLQIGRLCSIGPEVVFVFNNEHFTDCITTFPFKVKMLGSKDSEASSKGGIVVADDVWIGCRATILDGVSIGQGAIVAAGAVVADDVPPYAIVGGVPAKVIRFRHAPDVINELASFDLSPLLDPVFVQNHLYELYDHKIDPEKVRILKKSC